MKYRPSFASFDLTAGSALSAILPASFQAAGIGSACLALWLVSKYVLHFPINIGVLIEAIVAFFFSVFLATIVASIFCAMYIGMIGTPVAMLLGSHIERRFSGVIAVAAAFMAGLVAHYIIFSGYPRFETSDDLLVIALVLVYAIPAGLLYRRAIIAERALSPYD